MHIYGIRKGPVCFLFPFYFKNDILPNLKPLEYLYTNFYQPKFSTIFVRIKVFRCVFLKAFKKCKNFSCFRDLMKKRREKAVLVDRISRWLFPTRWIHQIYYMQIAIVYCLNFSVKNEVFEGWKMSQCDSMSHPKPVFLKIPLCELFRKWKGDQNFGV